MSTPSVISLADGGMGWVADPNVPRLMLLGGFCLRHRNEVVDVPPAGQRVLALLALRATDGSRSAVAGTLWPEKNQTRAAANLRSALWRMPSGVRAEIDSTGARLALSGRWSIDLVEAANAAANLRCSSVDVSLATMSLFNADLLAEWDEPWLLIERERFHQLRIHVLESLAGRQLEQGDLALAAETALAAIAAEPLRESAYALLIRAEIEAGNRAAAIEQYRRLRALLLDECGVAPSPRLQSLIAPLLEGELSAATTG